MKPIQEERWRVSDRDPLLVESMTDEVAKCSTEEDARRVAHFPDVVRELQGLLKGYEEHIPYTTQTSIRRLLKRAGVVE